MQHLSWVEISKEGFLHNVKAFRQIIGGRIFCGIVKGNAYGHGIRECVSILNETDVDWFGVNSLEEARIVRSISRKPIYIMGYVGVESLEEVISLDVRIVVYNRETVKKLGEIGEKLQKRIPVHVKVETGNYRQGVLEQDVFDFVRFILSHPMLELEGITTHFSNIEDTVDSSYSDQQLFLFKKIIHDLEVIGISIPIKHCANSAATLLFPQTHFDMTRVGIGLYGLYPSENILNKKIIQLRPVMSWKTLVAQIKNIPIGVSVGYGCTYVVKRPTKLAILPVGYFDGYGRSLSNRGFVLIRGKKVPVLGRICMNIMMVDVTDIPEVQLEDYVTLIGEGITAEDVAEKSGTIHYEMVTRIRESTPRIIV